MKRSFLLFFICTLAVLTLCTACAPMEDAARGARDIVSDVGDGVSDILTPDSSAPNTMDSSEIPADSDNNTSNGTNDSSHPVLPDGGVVSTPDSGMFPGGNAGILPTPGTDNNDTLLPEGEGTNTPSIMDTTDAPDTSRNDDTTARPDTSDDTTRDNGTDTTNTPETDDNDFDEPQENASLWGIIVAIVVVVAIIGIVVMLIPKRKK